MSAVGLSDETRSPQPPTVGGGISLGLSLGKPLPKLKKPLKSLPTLGACPRINWLSQAKLTQCAGTVWPLTFFGAVRFSAASLLLALGALATGCIASQGRREPYADLPRPPRVLVVAPVLNLSGTEEFDPLQVTDILASEFVSFRGVTVIPVNLTLAALARHGKTRVETPLDALRLAREFGADATVVTAITEYSPYDPPAIGLIMQWYAPDTASSVEAAAPAADLSGMANSTPRWQVQCVFNAAHESVRQKLEDYVEKRAADEGPYGWRKYLRSQKLYVRYCCWELIRTMLRQADHEPDSRKPNEAEP